LDLPRERRGSKRLICLPTAKPEEDRMQYIARLEPFDSGAALSAKDWAAQISVAWAKPVTAIVETGRLLIEAKKHLSRGEWLPMVKKQLPFSAATAEQLIAIAQHPVLSKSEHVQNLPPSWGTLYQLSRLSDREVEAGIASGAIHPGMQRKDAMALCGRSGASRGKDASRPGARRTGGDYIDAIQGLISEAMDSLLPAQQPQFFAELRGILSRWEEKAAPSAFEQPAKLLH
jgi:hypothetical protein